MATYRNPSTEIYQQVQNGRVIQLTNAPNVDFSLFTDNNNKDNSFKNIALQGIQQKTPLNQLFFSKRNMDNIQAKIRYAVYIRSKGNYIIGNQSDVELEVIMRSYYLQHAKNLPCRLREQVDELNALIIEWCVEQILVEVKQYYGYLENVQQLPIPLEHPKNLSSAGTKTLRSVTTTF